MVVPDSNEAWQFGPHWGVSSSSATVTSLDLNGSDLDDLNVKSTTVTQIPVLDLFAATYAACFP